MFWIIGFLAFAIIFAGLYSYGKYNHFKELSSKCNSALNDMEAFTLRKKNALLGLSAGFPQLLDYEAIRELDISSQTPQELNEKREILDNQAINLNNIQKDSCDTAVLPDYFSCTMAINGADMDIKNAIEIYNESALIYNDAISTFPGNMLAKKLKLESKYVFE